MSRLTKPVLLTFIAATLIGACLHFVYALFPCAFTALFSPVNESLWEHVKILYWPALIASLLLSRRQEPGALGARCLALLAGAGLMLLVGYIYHVILGGESPGFDIILYVALMALVLLLPTALPSSRWAAHAPVLVLLAAALGVAVVLFTFLPPSMILFTDLSGANTWSTLPC